MTGPDVTLPDRITVLTCIGCGAMGRQEGCEGACSEHKLVLVTAADHDALLAAAHTARERAARIAPVARALAEADVGDPRSAWLDAQQTARRTLRELAPEPPPTDWAAPGTVTGWWCARCGNVDLPQPCIGVCVWRPAEWVSLALYDRQLLAAGPIISSAGRLSRLLTRMATITPRSGQWERNVQALRRQAGVALQGYTPDATAPDAPRDAAPADPEPPARLHSWPR